MALEQTLPTIAVFIAAALLWSGSGILKSLGRHIKFVRANGSAVPDPNWRGIDKEAIKSDVILGLALGIIGFFFNSINPQVSIDFSSIPTFVAGLVPTYGLIALVDNTIVEPFLSK